MSTNRFVDSLIEALDFLLGFCWVAGDAADELPILQGNVELAARFPFTGTLGNVFGLSRLPPGTGLPGRIA